MPILVRMKPVAQARVTMADFEPQIVVMQHDPIDGHTKPADVPRSGIDLGRHRAARPVRLPAGTVKR